MIPVPAPATVSRACHRDHHRRGIALLLVMIGLVVCTILTAGFLASQGTAIGIARNERDAQKCRALAQSGVDMCFWLIRNNSTWRENMTPGTWLNSYSISGGTVTVTAADGDGTNNFADDPTQAVILTSTGTYDNRNYTLTATIRPTGGGTVFNAGNFVQGSITLENWDLLTQAIIDSYNSGSGAYNPGNPGTNAAFGSNATSSGSLTIYTPSIYRGTYTGGVGSVLSSLLNTLGLGILDIFSGVGPSTVTAAGETRIPGSAVAPNISSLTARAAFSANSGTTPLPGAGNYPSITTSGTATVNINAPGIYYVSGNATINGGSTLSVLSGIGATLYVNGNLTIKGQVKLTGTGTLNIYCANPPTISGANCNVNGTTANLTIFGLPSCNQIQITSNSNITGSVFAPQAAFTMGSGNNKFFGAMIVNSLTVQSTSQLHFDEALRTARIDAITGGSAAPGTADYSISVTGGPGMH